MVSVKYEAAGGQYEDPDEETLEPGSIRNTVTLRAREEADPAAFTLMLRTSLKDYFQERGDYSYLEAEHEGAFRLDDTWKLGYLLGVKSLGYAEPDAAGRSDDSLSFKAGGTAVITPVRGTSLEAGVFGRFTCAATPADAFQGYVLTAGLASRMGEWLLGIHYRGELRLPMGSSSSVTTRTWNTGSISLQWDPNR